MKLNVRERLVALNLLPQEGTFTNLKLIRVAREELSFNEAENKALKFQQKDNQLMWNPKAETIKEINLGEMVSLMLVDALKKLDTDGKLREEHFSLYEKMIKQEK